MRKTPLWSVFFTLKAIFAFFSPQRCNVRPPGDASHGCGMSPLTQQLLRMGRAPGFGRSSRIAIGKEAASDEDRRGICCLMPSSISGKRIFDINLVRKKRRNKRWFIYLFVDSCISWFKYCLICFFVRWSVASMQRCDVWLPGCASHGCMMSPLTQQLLRMGRAPGFGRSSRIAMGKEAVSGEDRRGLQNFKQTGNAGLRKPYYQKNVLLYLIWNDQ
jgi:hypothetical protein